MDGVDPRIQIDDDADDAPDLEAADGGDADPQAPDGGADDLEAADGGDADPQAPDGGDDDFEAADGGDDDLDAPDGGDADLEVPDFGDVAPEAPEDRDDDLGASDFRVGDPQTAAKGDGDPQAAAQGAAAQGDGDPHAASLAAFIEADAQAAAPFIEAVDGALTAQSKAAEAAAEASKSNELAALAHTVQRAYYYRGDSDALSTLFNRVVGPAKATAEVEALSRQFAASDAVEAAKVALADLENVRFSARAEPNEAMIKVFLAWVRAVAVTNANRSEKWQEFMKSHSDIGMLTIMLMHNKENLWNYLFVWCLLTLVLVAQLMLPILLLLYAQQTYSIPSFCPNSAGTLPRVVAFAIGCIYLVRISFLLKSKTSEHYVTLRAGPFRSYANSFSEHFMRWSEGGVHFINNLDVVLALYLDHFMDVWYEVFVYGINLFIVFATPDPLDMVLNSLAFEFILQLDDVVKEKYISIVVQDEKKYFFTYAMNHHSIIEKYDERFLLTFDATEPEWTYQLQALYDVYDVWIGYVVPILACTSPPLTLFYLSYCKPDGNLSDCCK
ncbi:hypothetical protein MHU86_11682 [Fragilaria crotonensis]|nr:hypothetical protein MHU86_11682 [Fragilaria crotonensis]